MGLYNTSEAYLYIKIFGQKRASEALDSPLIKMDCDFEVSYRQLQELGINATSVGIFLVLLPKISMVMFFADNEL